MKFDFIADTNFLIYVHEGHKMVEPFLKFNFGISFISEVELLGFKGISKSDEMPMRKTLTQGDDYLGHSM
jgi:hypothetical protein